MQMERADALEAEQGLGNELDVGSEGKNRGRQ